MSALDNLEMNDAIPGEVDVVGGRLHESGLYPCTIKLAYMGESSGGAVSLTLKLEGDQKQDITKTIYLTSGKAKGQKNTYINKAGEEQYLPGFSMGQALATLTLGKSISELAKATTEKTIDVYNFEAKSDIPTKVPMIMELINQRILVGLIKRTVTKQAKNDAGIYVDTEDTRDENEIDKFFHIDSRMTTSEVLAKAEVAKYVDTWDNNNTGITQDRTRKVAGTKGTPKGKVASNTKPTESLFEKSADK